MQVESSATPLLTEDKASSLPGQFCPFHPLSTLELEEKAQGFFYVHCPAPPVAVQIPVLTPEIFSVSLHQSAHLGDLTYRAQQLILLPPCCKPSTCLQIQIWKDSQQQIKISSSPKGIVWITHLNEWWWVDARVIPYHFNDIYINQDQLAVTWEAGT